MTKKIIVILALSGFIKSYAQDTMRIDVVKPFIATLSDAIKIQSNPNPEVPQVKKDTFVYNLPALIAEDKPTVYTIKPLSLGTSLLPKLKNNYVRIGFGNYATPLIEGYLATMRNRNLQAGVSFKHLSSSASPERKFSTNILNLHGKKFIPNAVISAEINYKRNVNHIYASNYDGTTQLNPSPNLQNLVNTMPLFEIKGGYANVLKDTSKLGYDLHASYYNQGLNFSKELSEGDFTISGNFRKSIQGNPLEVFTSVETNNNKLDSFTYQRLWIEVNPTYMLRMGKAYIKLGFNSVYFSDDNKSEFHFFPKAEGGYSIINNSLTGYGGFRGNLKKNTLRSITEENPFVRSVSYANTINQFELYAGLKGLISAQTSFILQFSLSSVKNLLFYSADSGLYNQKPVYDGSTSGLTNISAELNHEFGNDFRFGFVMNYYRYALSYSDPYSRPTFTTSVNTLYNIGNKFFLKGEIYTMNKRVARIDKPNGSYITSNLGGLVDVNLGIDYRYNRNVKLFLNINNLTNNQYQRWVNMPVFGINAIGGLGITF